MLAVRRSHLLKSGHFDPVPISFRSLVRVSPFLFLTFLLLGCDRAKDDRPQFPVTFEATINGEPWRATAAAVQQDDGTLILNADQYSDQVDDPDAGPSSAVQNTAGSPFVRATIRCSIPDFSGEGTYELTEGSAQFLRLIGGDVIGLTAGSRDGVLRVTSFETGSDCLYGEVEFVGRTSQEGPFNLRDGRFAASVRNEGALPPGNDCRQ